MSDWLVVVTAGVAIASGIVGGVFFAFSTFVMKALDRLAPADSIRAMQAINDTVPTDAWFMVVFLGTAVASVVVAIAAIGRWGQAGAAYQLAGCGAYLVAVVLTIAYHVPRNDALGRLDPAAVDAANEWSGYSSGWTAWNHVRVLGPAAAAILFTLALRAA